MVQVPSYPAVWSLRHEHTTAACAVCSPACKVAACSWQVQELFRTFVQYRDDRHDMLEYLPNGITTSRQHQHALTSFSPAGEVNCARLACTCSASRAGDFTNILAGSLQGWPSIITQRWSPSSVSSACKGAHIPSQSPTGSGPVKAPQSRVGESNEFGGDGLPKDCAARKG